MYRTRLRTKALRGGLSLDCDKGQLTKTQWSNLAKRHFVNKVLLGCSHIHLFIQYLKLFDSDNTANVFDGYHMINTVEIFVVRPDPLQKRFSDLWPMRLVWKMEYFYSSVLGIELNTSCLLSMCSSHELYPQTLCVFSYLAWDKISYDKTKLYIGMMSLPFTCMKLF